MGHHEFLIRGAIKNASPAVGGSIEKSPEAPQTGDTKEALKKILLNVALIPAGGLAGLAVGGTGGWMAGDVLSSLLKGKPVADWARAGQRLGQVAGVLGGSVGGGYAAHKLSEKKDEKKSS